MSALLLIGPGEFLVDVAGNEGCLTRAWNSVFMSRASCLCDILAAGVCSTLRMWVEDQREDFGGRLVGFVRVARDA